MMTRMLQAAAVAAVAATVAFTAPAQAGPGWRINGDLNYLALKIEEGRADGTITFFEGRRLRRELARVIRLKDRFTSDGVLSRRELRIMRGALKRLRVSIAAERTDRWRRLRILPRVGT